MRFGYMILGWVLISGCIVFGNTVSAYEDRDLPGIDLITREERGADESRKRADSGFYDWFIKNNTQYENREKGDLVDVSGVYASRQTRGVVNQKKTSFLQSNFPNDIETDEIVEEEDGHALRRPIELKENKTKIVIHHTASTSDQSSQEKIEQGLQYIYKLHAHTNGRGDVGYNFFIDKQGNVYEGRAGGPGTVGAHASRNNVSTIGISLLGNYDEEQPTPEMMESLTRLITILALQYDITPKEKQYYFTETTLEPYIEVHEHDSIVGHRDTKSTACPGKYVYEKIPALKETVAQYLTYFQKEDINDIDDVEFMHGEGVVYFEEERGILRVPFEGDGDVQCRSFGDAVDIRDCRLDNDELLVSLRREDYPASGPFTFGVHTEGGAFFVETTLLRYEDLQEHLSRNKKAYMAAHGLQTASKESEKIEDRIDLDEVDDLMNEDVKVLLYEVTADFNTRQIACEEGCDVEVDGERIANNTNAVLITQNDDTVTVSAQGETVEGEAVEIQNNGEFLEITNYPRGANGLAYNIFRGNVRIEQQTYNNLTNGMTEDFVVINDVPFEDYLHGIAETSEKQEDEKLKTIAMLVKNYALFYLKGTNPHPSIPEGASYNAVDDPRIFQKYVGAGFESYGKKRHDALRETEDLVILYDGYLPILPYFHCSAGFTRSGEEKRGRTDTPRLKSKNDFVECESGDFEGHGVGLSGDGAQKLAEKGATFVEILLWYYEGIEIQEINN